MLFLARQWAEEACRSVSASAESEEEPSSAAAHDVLLREATPEEQEETRLHEAQDILEQESQAEELLLEEAPLASALAEPAAPAPPAAAASAAGVALLQVLLFALCLWLGLLVSLPDVVAMLASYSALLLCVRSWPLVHYEHCRRWTMLAASTATFAVTRCLCTALLGLSLIHI